MQSDNLTQKTEQDKNIIVEVDVNSKNDNNNNKENSIYEKKKSPAEPIGSCITIADIVGEFGFYQLSITIITFIRYVCVAMMTNTGPLIAPELQFWCVLPADLDNNNTWENVVKESNVTSLKDYLEKRCQIEFINKSSYECSQYTYNTTNYGLTLTDSFDLVCQRDWLRSAFQSTVSVGVVIAAVVWGSFSDKHGRSITIRLSFLGALISGVISYFANSLLLYTLSRSFCSFCELGLVVSLSTIIVELLGNKYRGAVCIIVYTGWAFGVMTMPWITEHFKNYRHVMLFTISLHILTLPWLLTVKESVRWSLVNGRIEEAGEELKRINRWNCKDDKASLEEAEKKFCQFKVKYVRMAEKNRARDREDGKKSLFNEIFMSMFGGLSKISLIFQSRELIVTTLTLIWTTFNCEALYMFTILINNDIGDKKLNYFIGGMMEILASLISIVMISQMTRRLSLVTCLGLVSFLCLILSFTHQEPTASTWFLNLTKLAISTLSSLIYVVTTETFPTNLRQTGFGLAGTVGSFGAVVAPFVRTELAETIGMSKVLLIFVILPLTAAILIPFFLRETKGMDLSDDVDDFDNEIVEEDINNNDNTSNKSEDLKKISTVSVL